MKLNKQILLTQPIHPKGMQMLQEAVEKVVLAPDSKPETILSLLDDKVDGVIVRYNVFHKEMFEKAQNLKVVARHGIGVELIDLEAATQHGVMVVNTPDAATASVAEHVMMMALVLCRKLCIAQDALRAGDYAIKDSYAPDDVEDKVIGFIGIGRIGLAAAARCNGTGMKSIAYDPFVSGEAADKLGIRLVGSMEEVLREADFVSLHTPLTPETKHMIGDDQFAMMKPTAYLINCSRGAVVDEQALIRALKSKTIAGAGLDVFEQEPPAANNELFRMNNVIVTPHSSSLTLAGKVKMATGAVEQLLKVLRGEKPDYLVNKDVLGK